MNISIKKLLAPLSAAIAIAALASSPNTASASGISVSSIGSCPSGDLCVWSGANYTGTIKTYSATGTYLNISLTTTGSMYNNRSKRSNIYENSGGGGVWACFNPGDKKPALSGWLTSAGSAYLSTSTNC